MTAYDWSATTATALALLFIFVYHLCTVFSSRNRTSPHPQSAPLPPPQVSVSEVVSEDDLELLIRNLDSPSLENWETLIRRSTALVSYTASCSKPKDGPLKYLSTTVFENCSPELLRDFYMDNSYRKQWDKTVVDHVQLQVDAASGTEVGRTIKKFPLLTAREYVLGWRLWKGSDSAYYCFTKECNHPLAPQHKKYVRVRYFRSGWRIRKVVAGTNAAEIKMFHQEDAGLNMDMAKLAFAKGIWSYVLKMERALRAYSTASRAQDHTSTSSITLIQKVPPRLDRLNSNDPVSTCIATTIHGQSEGGRKSRSPSRRVMANSFLIIGGLVCLSKGQSSLCAKVAVAYLLAKLHKGIDSSGQSRST